MSEETETTEASPAFAKPTPKQLADISTHINAFLADIATRLNNKTLPENAEETIAETVLGDDDGGVCGNDFLPPKPAYFAYLTPYPRCGFCSEAESLHDANGKTVICGGYSFDPGLSYDPTRYSDKFVGDL